MDGWIGRIQALLPNPLESLEYRLDTLGIPEAAAEETKGREGSGDTWCLPLGAREPGGCLGRGQMCQFPVTDRGGEGEPGQSCRCVTPGARVRERL